MNAPMMENGKRVRVVLSDHDPSEFKTLGFGLYVGPVPRTHYHAVAMERPDGSIGIADRLAILPARQIVEED